MDLISRKAALEAVKIPNGEYSNPSERHGIIAARVEARRRIMDIPSVPAVPLDKLCEWLARNAFAFECKDCEEYCRAMLECENEVGSDPEYWKNKLTKWMEGLDDHR